MSGLSVSVRVEDRGVDLSLDVGADEVVALLGPNGAGKSTLLAVLAGLLRPDTGHAVLEDRVLLDVGRGGRDVWVPAHDRGVALLAQEPLLFPHLSALENVAFGPRSAGRGRREARESGRRWLAEVDATAYEGRRPGQLSGGQAQRVAVARALATEPRLLLLDEPMAALDVAVAPALRQLLRRVLAGRPVVLVTHDVLDALLLADRVVVVEDGKVVEQGPTAALLGRPRSDFAARIAGLNLVRGTYDGSGVRAASGLRLEGLAEEAVAPADPALAVFRPSAVAVFRTPPGGSPRNVIDVRITELEPHGDQVRVRAGELSADVTTGSVAELGLAPGVDVVFGVKASEVAVYRA